MTAENMKADRESIELWIGNLISTIGSPVHVYGFSTSEQVLADGVGQPFLLRRSDGFVEPFASGASLPQPASVEWQLFYENGEARYAAYLWACAGALGERAPLRHLTPPGDFGARSEPPLRMRPGWESTVLTQ